MHIIYVLYKNIYIVFRMHTHIYVCRYISYDTSVCIHYVCFSYTHKHICIPHVPFIVTQTHAHNMCLSYACKHIWTSFFYAHICIYACHMCLYLYLWFSKIKIMYTLCTSSIVIWFFTLSFFCFSLSQNIHLSTPIDLVFQCSIIFHSWRIYSYGFITARYLIILYG